MIFLICTRWHGAVSELDWIGWMRRDCIKFNKDVCWHGDTLTCGKSCAKVLLKLFWIFLGRFGQFFITWILGGGPHTYWDCPHNPASVSLKLDSDLLRPTSHLGRKGQTKEARGPPAWTGPGLLVMNIWMEKNDSATFLVPFLGCLQRQRSRLGL